ITVGLDSKVRWLEVIGTEAVYRSAIDGQACRVHRIGADQIIAAEHIKLAEMVFAAEKRVQRIVGCFLERNSVDHPEKHRASEDGMLVTLVIVHFADVLPFVCAGLPGVSNSAALIYRVGKLGDEVQCSLAE